MFAALSIAVVADKCATAAWTDYCSALWGTSSARLCCDRPTCCDNYCRPPFPYADPNCAKTCDTYCRPPIPCVFPSCRACCNDYCRPPLPCVNCLTCTQFHRCQPPCESTNLTVETQSVSIDGRE